MAPRSRHVVSHHAKLNSSISRELVLGLADQSHHWIHWTRSFHLRCLPGRQQYQKPVNEHHFMAPQAENFWKTRSRAPPRDQINWPITVLESVDSQLSFEGSHDPRLRNFFYSIQKKLTKYRIWNVQNFRKLVHTRSLIGQSISKLAHS